MNYSRQMVTLFGSMLDYTTFRDEGPTQFLAGYKRIIVQFALAAKHELRHKARLVAGGHLTPATLEGTYSGLVSVRSLRILVVAALAAKHELRHKARLVAGSHLTPPTLEGTYSGLVLVRSLRI